jgi:hypothetical protein
MPAHGNAAAFGAGSSAGRIGLGDLRVFDPNIRRFKAIWL